MASSELSARVRYLNDSAHLLRTASPATSRHLVSVCNALIFDNHLELPESQKRKACMGCGAILVLGWDNQLRIESRIPRRGRNVNKRERTLVYHCGSCDSRTRSSLNTAPPPNKRTPKSNSVSLLSPAHIAALQAPSNVKGNYPSANSSKKAAKTKKLAGLGALLAKKKAAETSASGLSLMDFMKKG